MVPLYSLCYIIVLLKKKRNKQDNLSANKYLSERKTFVVFYNPSQLFDLCERKKKYVVRHRALERSLSLQKPHLKHSFTQRQKNQHVATRVWYYHAETLV